MNHYKGFAGAVKSIQCSFLASQGSEDSDAGQLVAACGLDRYLRVYTIQPPKLTHQVATTNSQWKIQWGLGGGGGKGALFLSFFPGTSLSLSPPSHLSIFVHSITYSFSYIYTKLSCH